MDIREGDRVEVTYPTGTQLIGKVREISEYGDRLVVEKQYPDSDSGIVIHEHEIKSVRVLERAVTPGLYIAYSDHSAMFYVVLNSGKVRLTTNPAVSGSWISETVPGSRLRRIADLPDEWIDL